MPFTTTTIDVCIVDGPGRPTGGRENRASAGRPRFLDNAGRYNRALTAAFFCGACCTIVLALAAPLPAEPPPHAQWELSFRDEFDGDSLSYEVWESQAGPRSPEDLESRWPENNLVRDGLLCQVTRREASPRAGKNWTTAHIWTRTFQQQYGYFEARIRYGRYLNNAFWLFRPMGKRFAEPPHFEIDINEGHTPSTVNMTFHHYFFLEGTRQRDRWSTHEHWTAPVDLEADFHVYGLEWDQEQMIWYVDGKPVRRVANRWAQAPADVRLSTVIMPRQLAKDGKPLDSMDGASMATDWVRVYRKVRNLAAPADLPALEPGEMPRPVHRDPQVADGSRKIVLLEEDFQTAGADGLPAGWQIGQGQPAVESERASPGAKRPAKGNQVLRLKPGDYVFRMFDRLAAGRLEVEFDYYCPLGKNGLLLSTLGKFDSTNSRLLPNSYYAGDIGAYLHWASRSINYYTQEEGWTPMADYRGGQWSHFRVLIDVPRRVFDVFAGAPATGFLSGGPFRGKQKAACGIALRHHGTSDTIYLDKLVVRTVDD